MPPQARTISEKKFTVRFSNDASGQDVTVDIFDIIDDWWGWGVDRLARALHGHTGAIKVRVNSFGGDLLQGLAIKNFLAEHPGTVTVEVMGVAASAATFIVAGADRALMHEGSFLMIHNPLLFTYGNADELEQGAGTLKKMEGEMANVYLSAMKKRKHLEDEAATLAKIRAWMDAETWFTPAEAVEYGFADEVVQSGTQSDTAIQVSAQSFQNFQNAYRNTPQRVLNLTHTQDTTMSDKNGIIEQIRSLLSPAKADATTDATPAEDPVEAAKKLLEQSGYAVTEKSAEQTPDPVVETPDPVENNGKTYTEAEIIALIANAVQSETDRIKATAEAAKNPTAPKATTEQGKSKADQLRQKAVPAFDALAKLVQGR